MRGTIINFNLQKGFGFIRGINGEQYFFHISNVITPENISINNKVEFQPSSNNKGLLALNISMGLNISNNDPFLELGTARIRKSEIKRYEVETRWAGDAEYETLIIYTYDGNLIQISDLHENFCARNIMYYLDEEMKNN